MRHRLALAFTTIAAAASVGLTATPSQALPTGALVMGPLNTSTIFATVVQGQELAVVNLDATTHSVSATATVLGGGTISFSVAPGTAFKTITNPVGVYVGTVQGSASTAIPVVITVVDVAF